jgi:hypothetical protein
MHASMSRKLTRSLEEGGLLELGVSIVSSDSESVQLEVPIPVPLQLLRREHAATVVAVQGHGVLVWRKQGPRVIWLVVASGGCACPLAVLK